MSRTTYITDNTPGPEPSRSRCDNCGKEEETQHLGPIFDLEQRIEAGGVVPSGECLECGSLCYLAKPASRPPQSVVLLAEQLKNTEADLAILLERLLNWCQYIGGSEANVWKDVSNLHEKLTGRRIDV